jgi:hypothetical protein
MSVVSRKRRATHFKQLNRPLQFPKRVNIALRNATIISTDPSSYNLLGPKVSEAVPSGDRLIGPTDQSLSSLGARAIAQTHGRSRRSLAFPPIVQGQHPRLLCRSNPSSAAIYTNERGIDQFLCLFNEDYSPVVPKWRIDLLLGRPMRKRRNEKLRSERLEIGMCVEMTRVLEYTALLTRYAVGDF